MGNPLCCTRDLAQAQKSQCLVTDFNRILEKIKPTQAFLKGESQSITDDDILWARSSNAQGYLQVFKYKMKKSRDLLYHHGLVLHVFDNDYSYWVLDFSSEGMGKVKGKNLAGTHDKNLGKFRVDRVWDACCQASKPPYNLRSYNCNIWTKTVAEMLGITGLRFYHVALGD